ncbi:MAG: nicotinate phosphoribosyltransferase [bacterium]
MNNLFEFSDLSLTQLAPTYAQGSIWLEEGMDKQIATFDLLIRDMPKNRNYLVYGGLEEIVHYLKNLKYSDEQIQLLRKGGLITNKFAKYLEKFSFSGDVYALPEGTIFFPGEPIVRITAPVIEASLIEIALFGITVSNVIYLSKAARIKSVIENKSVSLGMQRAHSFESGLKGLRNGDICGLSANAWPVFVNKYKIPENREYLINGQHFFIKSFPNEITAFRKLAKYFPKDVSFMIDTYDISQGLKNAITIGRELKQKGHTLRYVTIDAGDLGKLSRMVRKGLDGNGLDKVKIIAATNLDEYKIKHLMKKKAPIDVFIVATEYSTMSDSPNIEVVYKIAELRDGKKIHNTAKLTPGKVSYPGRKQVFREFKKGKIYRDTIGLENEKFGTPLLKMVIKKGRPVVKMPKIKTIQKYFNRQLASIPTKLLDIEKKQTYQVDVSNKLKNLLTKVEQEQKSSK